MKNIINRKVLEVLGVVCIVVGAFLISDAAGWISAGVGLLNFSVRSTP